MHFASIRLITDDVNRLVDFYERITGLTATRYTPEFAELATPAGTLAIAGVATVEALGDDAPRPASNHSIIIEFRVEDVDREFEDLSPIVSEFVLEPITQPWGNRSVLFRDPDGNLVNFFTPVTPEARARASVTPRTS